MNMAVDEAIAEHVAKGSSPPTIRFYKWNPSAVSVGYFQVLSDEVDISECDTHNIDYVRRRTGGGAVYHDKELTYSVIAPEHLFPKDIIQSYREICSWIIAGLATLDIQAEFIPINDIITNGKKISGNAQTRKAGVLQQHGTILFDVDVDKMFSLLKVPNEKIKDKIVATVKERVTSVTHQTQCTEDQLYKALLSSFSTNKSVSFAPLTAEEEQLADELARKKYAAAEWNLQR